VAMPGKTLFFIYFFLFVYVIQSQINLIVAMPDCQY